MDTTMRNPFVKIGLILTLLVSPLIARCPVDMGAGDSPILDLPLTHDIDFSGTPAGALEEVLRGTQIAGGVTQQFQGCSTDYPIRLKTKKGTTVRVAMDNLVTNNPDYQWRVLDHVVTLAPRSGFPALLATRLHSYTLQSTDNWAPSASLATVFRVSEVRKRAAELRLRPGEATGNGLGGVELRPTPKSHRAITINLKDVSVQDVLNSVVKSYGNAIWIYTEIECNGDKTFTVNGW